MTATKPCPILSRLPEVSLPAFSIVEPYNRQRLMDAVTMTADEWDARYPEWAETAYNRHSDSVFDAFDGGLCTRAQAEAALGGTIAIDPKQCPRLWEDALTLPPEQFANGQHICPCAARSFQRATIEDALREGRAVNLKAARFYGLLPAMEEAPPAPPIPEVLSEQATFAI